MLKPTYAILTRRNFVKTCAAFAATSRAHAATPGISFPTAARDRRS